MNLTEFPVLETNRFNLIEITNSHLEDIFELYSETEVTNYIDITPLKNINEAKKEIEFYQKRFQNSIGIRWGIAFKGQNNIIGTLGYNKVIQGHKGRIGYDLLPKYWRKGIMAEVLETIINYGFNQFSLTRIEAEVMPGNIGSEKLLTKLQFQKEGILKNWMHWNNNFYDISMYALLKSK